MLAEPINRSVGVRRAALALRLRAPGSSQRAAPRPSKYGAACNDPPDSPAYRVSWRRAKHYAGPGRILRRAGRMRAGG